MSIRKGYNSSAATMVQLSSMLVGVSLFFLFVRVNGNVMNFDHNPNAPVTTKYSGRRDHSFSRNYPYPLQDDQPSGNNWGGGGNGGRQMSSLAATSLQSAASSDYLYGATAGDNYAAGTQSHGGGHGQGHKSSVYVNNSAVGLLGFLSLLSLIQNVLRQMTTTATGRRRKRNLDEERIEDASQKEVNDIDNLMQKLIPLLSSVAHARDGLIPVECSVRQICLANQLLSNTLGAHGKNIGGQLSTAIGKLLKEVDKSGTVVKMVVKAGKAGSSGEDCIRQYTQCATLRQLPTYHVPPSMLATSDNDDF